jgi:glycerate kinase
MRVLVAPSGLKECLAAPEAARALAEGVRRAGAEAVEVPLADGGAGMAACLAAATGGSLEHAEVTGPLGEAVTAAWARLGDGRTAAVEMAAAAGLALVPPGRRDPLRTTTRGVGELLRAAAEAGATRVVLGLGDSATCDGGAGMAGALGYRLLEETGEPIGPGAAGLEALARIERPVDDIARGGRADVLGGAKVVVASDVDNPLLGPRGAARVFGPQKGADAAAVERIEAALARFADVLRRDLGADVADLPGAGAAGGLGAGAVAFLGAQVRPGAELVLDAVGIDGHLARADLVLTAEGRFDAQSLGGKAPMALARRARAAGVPCVVIPGSRGPGAEAALAEGVTEIFPLVQGDVTLAAAVEQAAGLLADRAEAVVRRHARRTRRGPDSP